MMKVKTPMIDGVPKFDIDYPMSVFYTFISDGVYLIDASEDVLVSVAANTEYEIFE